jgi:hypothetical protein
MLLPLRLFKYSEHVHIDFRFHKYSEHVHIDSRFHKGNSVTVA